MALSKWEAAQAAKVEAAEAFAAATGREVSTILADLARTDSDLGKYLAEKSRRAVAALAKGAPAVAKVEAVAAAYFTARDALDSVDWDTVEAWVAENGVAAPDLAVVFPSIAALIAERAGKGNRKTPDSPSALSEAGGWTSLAAAGRFWFALKTIGKSGPMRSTKVYVVDPTTSTLYWYTNSLHSAHGALSEAASQTGRVRGGIGATAAFVESIFALAGVEGHEINERFIAASKNLGDLGDPETMTADELVTSFTTVTL